jgi:hypothetical protein
MNPIKGDLILSVGQIGYIAGHKRDPIQYLEMKSIIRYPSVSLVSLLSFRLP